jgi:hypothetical protein
MTAPEPIEIAGARARLYRDAPSWDGLRTAAIGEFSTPGAEAGRALLDAAADRLRGEGFAALVGPMSGDTWHSYRLVTESDGSKPFPLEPVNGPFDLAAFADAGFAPVSHYVSTRGLIADALAGRRRALPGLAVSAWDGKSSDALIAGLHEISLAAFAHNRFYKPVTLEAFTALYAPLVPRVDPRLILFGRIEGRIVSFLFAYPDFSEGAKAERLIFKSWATIVPGAGQPLVDTLNRSAAGMGYSRFIHALMHDDGRSQARSRYNHATVFRRYALMGRKLGPAAGEAATG